MSKTRSLARERAFKKIDKLLARGQAAQALAQLERLCGQQPDDGEAWLRLGRLRARAGEESAALHALQRAARLLPDHPAPLREAADLLARRGRWSEAEALYRQALARGQGDAALHRQLGLALEAQGRQQEAEEHYRRAIGLDPKQAGAALGLGRIARQQGRNGEAEEWLQRALELQPGLAAAHFERALLLRQRGEIEAALEALERFRERAPEERESYLLTRADLFALQKRYDEALACYDQATALAPRSPHVGWSRALTLLKLGRLKEGWEAFEWRRHYPDWQRQLGPYARLAPPEKAPDWRGKRVLIFAEQGFGDTIQFCRFLPRLIEQGAEVTLHCQPELVALLGSAFADIEVVARGEVAPEKFDLHLPLMSLPRLLQLYHPEKLAAPLPYLTPPRSARAVMATTVEKTEGLAIGVFWSDSPANPLDARRSLALDDLAPLAGLPGVRLHSLQLGVKPEEKEHPLWSTMTDHAHHMKDFAHTAALIERLDLIVSADTAVAHLAGALGRPVWTLLYHDPDWRWHIGRDGKRTPWYPAMGLLEQGAGEPWREVVERLAGRIAAGEAPAGKR